MGAKWIDAYNDSGVIRGAPCPLWPEWHCTAPGSDLHPCPSYRTHLTTGTTTRVLCDEAESFPPEDEVA